jgi:hypothetical protein
MGPRSAPASSWPPVGWLGALAHGRSRRGYLLLVVPAGVAALFSFSPRTGMGLTSPIIPSPDQGGNPTRFTMAALAMLTPEKETSEQDTAFLAWVNACLRMDRAAAEILTVRTLDAPEWNTKAAFWQDNDLLYIRRVPGEESAAPPRFRYSCLVITRQSETSPPPRIPRPYGVYFTADETAHWITITVTKNGGRWNAFQ